MLSLKEGTELVRMARERIRTYLRGDDYDTGEIDDKYKINSGIFVTLKTYPGKDLRGCIGFPEPVYPLIDSLLDASIASATRDPRFHPVSSSEIDRLLVEVTVLSSPSLIKGKSGKGYLDEIEVGRDGLIIERGFQKGLLLPQVPIEWNWGKEEFLSHTCVKAGLPQDCWLNEDDIKIYKFTGQVFSEIAPNGEVVEQERS